MVISKKTIICQDSRGVLNFPMGWGGSSLFVRGEVGAGIQMIIPK